MPFASHRHLQRDCLDKIGRRLFDLKDESVNDTREIVERHERRDADD